MKQKTSRVWAPIGFGVDDMNGCFIPVLNHFLNTKSVTKTGKFSVTKS